MCYGVCLCCGVMGYAIGCDCLVGLWGLLWGVIVLGLWGVVWV